MNPKETPPSPIPALSGLGAYAQRSRRNLIIGGLCGLAALGVGLALELDALRLGLILLTIALVISLEMLNTAIELLLDIVHPDFNSAVKHVKDLTAGAVLIAAIGALALGLLLVWEPLGLPAFELARFFVIAGLGIFLLGWILLSFTEG
jgi:diacylglycerol kinase